MKWYYWVGVVVFVVLGINILTPAPASKPSLLDYYAYYPHTYEYDNLLGIN